MRNLICVFLVCWFGSLFAQQGNMADGVYRIQIAAFKRPFNERVFERFNDLGALKFEPLENGFTRVSLGRYLGRPTANLVLQQVRRMGFPQAFMVVEDRKFVDFEARTTNTTLQFAAVKSLKLAKLMESLGTIYPQYLDAFYIQHIGGFYRLSLGLFAGDDVVAQGGFRALAQDLGYASPVLRTVRTGGAAPRPTDARPFGPVTPPSPEPAPAPTPAPTPTPTRPESQTKWNTGGTQTPQESQTKWNTGGTQTEPSSQTKWNTTPTPPKPQVPQAASGTTTDNPFTTRP